MIIDRTNGYLDEVRAFADSIKMREQLEEQLTYLANYACRPDGDTEKTRAILTKDFAPYSFNVVIEERPSPDAEYTYWLNGGLIFHGPHGGHGSGGAPTYSTCLEPTRGWAMHT